MLCPEKESSSFSLGKETLSKLLGLKLLVQAQPIGLSKKSKAPCFSGLFPHGQAQLTSLNTVYTILENGKCTLSYLLFYFFYKKLCNCSIYAVSGPYRGLEIPHMKFVNWAMKKIRVINLMTITVQGITTFII